MARIQTIVSAKVETYQDNGQTIADQRVAALEAENERLKARFTAPVVCLCGSVRFRSTWFDQMARLTDEGRIVLTVGRMLPKATGEFDPAHKERLDALHKRKIDLADEVLVLDVGGYIGDSTRSEIAYAESIERPVRYLSQEFPDYVEPADEISALRADLAALRQWVGTLTTQLGEAQHEVAPHPPERGAAESWTTCDCGMHRLVDQRCPSCGATEAIGGR